MKIALICSDSGSGGLLKYIQSFLETPTEHTVNLYCGKTIAIPESEYIRVIRTELAGESGMDLLLNRPLSSDFVGLIKHFSPDAVVFLNGFMRRGLQQHACISILHNQLAINWKMAIQQRPLRLVGSLLAVRKAVLFSFKAADGNIFLSYASKDETDQAHYQYKNGKVILFGHQASCTRNTRAQSTEMIYVSTQFPYKNHERLIRALGVVRGEMPDFHVSLVGCQETPRLRELIERNGLRDNVTFRGWLSHDDTKTLIGRASIYLHPSTIESTSNGVLEGVIEGNTIVCSRIPVFFEALGDKAYYFTPTSVDGMAHAILTALRSPKPLSDQDCRSICAPYDTKRMVETVYGFACELVEQ